MEKGKEIKLDKKPESRISNYTSVTCSISEDSAQELAILKDYLYKVGISVKATRYESTDVLTFIIDKEKYDKVVKRGAGRKKDYKLEEKYKKCTVSELKKMIETMKKSDIIKELGCPKRTFYNILNNIKEAEEFLDAEYEQGCDPSIWDYTS